MLKNKDKVKLRGLQVFIDESTFVAIKNLQKQRVERGEKLKVNASINTILNDFIDEWFIDYYQQEKERY
ncbi:hypothetical protein CKO50_20345 [Pseudoalteromonas sp. HM-SA03]|uniref:hypothetical protein n=1 Tax=Pseudoalteromonas sp. HM-SA03 TaxID=2029678 RepID=UPI000BAE4B3F|nr:hypothetical protein [Pseudoalteromonas sp. HM-SA03]PAX99564.1 hypothetical protein CKO50_20345 [Pseudoalteromonas sp. HM-SA03]